MLIRLRTVGRELPVKKIREDFSAGLFGSEALRAASISFLMFPSHVAGECQTAVLHALPFAEYFEGRLHETMYSGSPMVHGLLVPGHSRTAPVFLCAGILSGGGVG